MTSPAAISSSPTPVFRLGESRYDQSSFAGRLKHFFDVVDPRTLLTSGADLQRAVELLKEFELNGTKPNGVDDEQMWRAQKIKQAIIHPDTGEKVFMPFRMSGFVPFGAVTVFGLLLPNPSIRQMVFWQWLNQSHNACVNYANRNASQPTPMERFMVGYAGAITSACGIAVGLSLLLRRATKFTPTTRMIVQKFVPFPAVAAASVSNCILMRFSELKEGIQVKDKEGNVIGNSKAAAKKALKETAISRAMLPIPCFALPPVVMTLLERLPAFARRPRLHIPVLGVVSVASFGLGLPVAIALFPQFAEISSEKLEPELRARLDEKNEAQRSLIYNKGL